MTRTKLSSGFRELSAAERFEREAVSAVGTHHLEVVDDLRAERHRREGVAREPVEVQEVDPVLHFVELQPQQHERHSKQAVGVVSASWALPFGYGPQRTQQARRHMQN